MVDKDRSWSSVTADPTADTFEYYDGYPPDYDKWPYQKKMEWLEKQRNVLLSKLLKARQPPNTPFRTKITLNDDNWKPLTNLLRWGEIRVWKLRNMTHRFDRADQRQFIEWAYQDDPENFEIDDLGPGGIETQDTWPKDLWVRRTQTPVSRAFMPQVLIEIWYVKDIKKPEYQALWEDLESDRVDVWRQESIEVQGFDENDLFPQRY